MEGAENCTDTCVCRVCVVCEVPVCVIVRGGGCNTCTEEVARTLSGRRPEDKERGVGEGNRVGDRDGVGDGDGVDGTTTAVMTGTAVVVDISS